MTLEGLQCHQDEEEVLEGQERNRSEKVYLLFLFVCLLTCLVFSFVGNAAEVRGELE